jgi:dihydroorotate dehydrogenase
MATISVANRRAPTLARVLISRPNARGASTFVPTQSRVRNTLLAAILAASAGVFAVYYFDARSALHRYVLTPLIRHAVDPETGHRLAVKVLASGVAPRDPLVDDEKLKVQVRLTDFSAF